MRTTGVSRVEGFSLIRSQTSYPLSVGHQHIHQHKVGLLGRDHRQRLFAVGCRDNGVPFAREQRRQQPDVRRLVVNHEHFACGSLRIDARWYHYWTIP